MASRLILRSVLLARGIVVRRTVVPVCLQFRVEAKRHVVYSQRRSFASDKDILKFVSERKTVNRDSNYHPKANELINAIRARKYDLARKLVIVDLVPVDSHTLGENTALTDAASRGDVEGIRYLVKDLKANLHASCDCPDHQTALHYATSKNRTEAVKVLLLLGSRDDTLTNSGKKPSELTKNAEIKVLFQRNNPLLAKMLPGAKKGKDSVIYLS
ncbi:MAG: hypothetical protein Harvfovirus50_9 [Harvfovirus sp.]|uniref:Uncharacterized protein n=1 Tax=Harvfovirus sp. TaxID=2487768 RepID=A0A3G5A376_9VIRU|nr:MAG: hypothetical protein Harvfovirus50_9 [Harvfovirus sp.]